MFGDDNEKEIKRMQPFVEEINAFDPAMTSMSDVKLTAKTKEFQRRLEEGETLDDILPEAFAVVKETARRLKENATLESTATELDKTLAVTKKHIRIECDKAIFSNRCGMAGVLTATASSRGRMDFRSKRRLNL